jgi:hypothetical protein
MSASPLRTTDYPTIKNAPLVGLAEGVGSFNNYHLAGLLVGVPWIVKRITPVVCNGGFKTYVFMFVVCGVPTAIAYWTLVSMYGSRKNEKVTLPGKDIEEYITIHDSDLRMKYNKQHKIPMQVFHDAYFEGKIDFNGMFVASSSMVDRAEVA